MNEVLRAIKIHKTDNVATLLDDVKEGDSIHIKDDEGINEKVRANKDISYGHKTALTDINKGENIIKYGEIIGVANRDIKKGDHVHVHNLSGTRGRVD